MEASTSNHHLKGIIEVEDTMEAYISYGEEKACFYATTGYVADVPPMIELECEKARVRIVESHHCGQRWGDENDRLLGPGTSRQELLGGWTYGLYSQLL